jgi:hypothetical protein
MAEYSAYTDQESSLVLDLNSIHQIVDTLGNETYAIRVLNEMPSSKIFYNLILKYTPEGDARRPFLIRYEMDDETYLKYTSTGDLSNFRGKMQRHFIDKVGIKIPRSSSLGGGFEDGGIGGELPGVNSDPCPTQRTPGNGESGTNDGPPPEQAGSGCKLVEKRTEYYTRVCDSNGKNCGPRTYQYTIVSIAVECDGPSGGSTSSDNTTEVCEKETEEIPILEPSEIPCDGDPIKNFEIVSSGESGKRGGTFGYTRSSNTKFHDGIDVGATPGTAFFPIQEGEVIYIRDTFDIGEYKKDSYGNVITIRHTISSNEYLDLQYSHLDKVYVNVGDVVNFDTQLGETGITGNAASFGVKPHLHIKGAYYVGGSKIDREDIRNDPAQYTSSTILDNGDVVNSPCI